MLDYFLNIDMGTVKLVSFILCLLFGIPFFIIMKKIRELNRRKIRAYEAVLAPPVPGRSGVMAKWEEILTHISSTREFEWKFAIIEADKLVDEMLKSARYPGETMGERLVSIDKAQMESLDGLWEAHKLRNRIVHDTNYFMRYAEAKRAINFYEKTLRELGIL